MNRFGTDTDAELELVRNTCAAKGVKVALSEVFAKGGEGGIELANLVIEACEQPSDFKLLYPDYASLKDKILTVAEKIYGADGVNFEATALKSLSEIESLNSAYCRLPICVAKTQYSLSDDPSRLGRPSGFMITVRDVKLSAGAKFVVVYTGAIMTMPGLPKVPAALSIDVTDDGVITGLS